ncbi:MAG: PadR family transcriptional regulator [Thermoplasmatales archaeon]
MTRERIPKGILSMAILVTLWDRGGYGYLLQKDLESLIGFPLSRGEIYSMLRHLEIRGFVQRIEGNIAGARRTYYITTEKGKTFFLAQRETIIKTIRVMESLERFLEEHGTIS